jgi:hypothetical protein
MQRVKHDVPRFAVCINNAEYPASLQLHKIYRVIPDEDAAQVETFASLMKAAKCSYLYIRPASLHPEVVEAPLCHGHPSVPLSSRMSRSTLFCGTSLIHSLKLSDFVAA